MSDYGPEFEVSLSEWEMCVYGGKSPCEDDTQHSFYFTAVGKWYPFEHSELTIKRGGKTYNLTDLPVQVKLYVGSDQKQGHLYFHQARESKYDPGKSHGAMLSW